MRKPEYVPIVGTDLDGQRWFYTGRAGQAFISREPKKAFMGYTTIEGAQNRAKTLNTMTSVHGIWFIACTGTLAEEIRNAQSR